MIKPGEIQQKAREVGVRDQQIEKDYVLSWILKGIAQHDQLSKSIVFKGGTVLKKVCFEDYRYSEDLDFTLLNNEDDRTIVLITNNMEWEDATIAELYKRRWLIETFFKLMKQNLQIKTFLGTSNNRLGYM